MLPPRIIRRLILAPLVFVITVAAIVLSPLLFLLALVTAPSRPRRRRTLRLIWFGLAWLVMETMALAACLGLWLASGFGGRLRSDAWQERHYGLVRWFLATLFRIATRVFGLRVEIEEPPATPEELAARLTRPVIVLSRHAGPGDSFLLVHHLLSLYRRRPRIVMKAALQFDPSLDVVINRLPHAFVKPARRAVAKVVAAAKPAAASAEAANSEATPPAEPATPSPVIDEIRRLSAGLGPTGALVIFPEGGNFTPLRWRRGIRRLEESRRFVEARRAERMKNLLPPRTGGAFAAIDSASTADVIFVAHTGLDDLITVGDVWRSLPMEQVIKARWWRVPAADVPRDRESLGPWLYDWWETIDRWIAQHRPHSSNLTSERTMTQPAQTGETERTSPPTEAIETTEAGTEPYAS
jgi:1-acyl-sn-glycerol-3-phosphate acyltransferase